MRLLIIDDNKSICKMLAQNYSGKFITRASFGNENIFCLINDFKPDVLLIDYILPNFNGSKLCKMIKLNPETILVLLFYFPLPQ